MSESTRLALISVLGTIIVALITQYFQYLIEKYKVDAAREQNNEGRKREHKTKKSSSEDIIPKRTKLRMKWAISILFGILVGVLLFLLVKPGNTNVSPQPPAPTPTALPIPMASLSEARVEFIVTYSDGSQITIGADGVLTLAANDKVIVKVRVSNLDHSPFTHELLYKYYFASGGGVDGDTAPYIAERADIITIWITDKVTRDEVFRNMRVVIK